MMMKSRAVKNLGYLLVLTPQILLVVGAYTGFFWLSLLFFFVALPLLRKFVGNDLSEPNKTPSKSLTLFLQFIPRLYVAMWSVVLPWCIWFLSKNSLSVFDYISFGLALWIVSSLNTAVGHELIHARSRFDRKLGAVLNASVGYFHFSEEHLNHHAKSGHYYGGDAAVPGTSIYVFAVNRYLRSLSDAWDYETSRLKRNKKSFFENRLFRKAVVPILIGSIFAIYAGVAGLSIYLFQIIGAAFTVQAITYLQHWGLTEKETPELGDFGYSWEDGCWMQACVTLNHAFHGQHHLVSSRPYYELGAIKGGLTLPASYPVMFVVAFFPTFFTRIMKCRLETWIKNFELGEVTKHNSDCIGAARLAKSIKVGY